MGNPLLQPVEPGVAEAYYATLIGGLGHSVEVRPDAGGSRGKGVFATAPIAAGQVVLSERPLAAAQHFENKMEVSTCAHCFTAVGTVEQHFGGKICCLINDLEDAAEEGGDLSALQDRVDKVHAAVDGRLLEALLSNSMRLPLTEKVDMAQPVSCRGGCGEEYCSPECEAEAWSRYHCLLCPVGDSEAGGANSSGAGPSGGGGGEGKDGGKGKAPAAPQRKGSSGGGGRSARGSGAGASAGSSSGGSSARRQPPQLVHGVMVDRSRLAAFLEHADETNDIFRVAAQVVAATLVAADGLLAQAAADEAEDAEAAAACARAAAAASVGGSGGAGGAEVAAAAAAAAVPVDGEDAAAAAAAFARAVDAARRAGSSQRVLVREGVLPTAVAGSGSAAGSGDPRERHLAALRSAFLPFALGHKAPWWDVVSDQERAGGGSDSDSGSSAGGVEELRAQLRELAADSLALLGAALRDDRFPQLFDLDLYGSLVGMFELNNLALAVPAPVGRYKAALAAPAEAGLDPAEAAAALKEVQPLLDALGDAADAPADGTGFYALQSCINHSCAPNAAASCLPDGRMVVSAARDIPAGGEVLISYIDEAEGGLEERRRALADYGFTCTCQRCAAEELAAGLDRQSLAAA